MKIQAKKLYRTRDGSLARVYATDGGEPFPIHGAVFDPKLKEWNSCTWHKDGRSYATHENEDDLVEENKDQAT